MSNFNNDSKKALVAQVLQYNLRILDEKVAALMDLGIESVDDLEHLTEQDILDQQIPIIHFRRAKKNQWDVPHLPFLKPDVPMEDITIAPIADVGGEEVPIEELDFRDDYNDITVPHRTIPGRRVIAIGRADYDGNSTEYKIMCDFQLAQSLSGALRQLGITSLPSSPTNYNDTFHLKKFLDVGEIQVSENTSFMYNAQVTGKDVFFNILQRGGGRPNPNDSSQTSEERDLQFYSVLKEYLTNMLPDRKFRTAYGGMSSPPDTTEQQHIIRYIGGAASFVGKHVALYNTYYKGFVSLHPDGIPRSLPWDKDPSRLEKKSRTWERFLVVDGGEGFICLYNIQHQKFLRIQGNKVDTGRVRDGPGDLPAYSDWPSERFEVVPHPGWEENGPPGFAFHNPHWNRFIRLCNAEVDAKGGEKRSTSLPSKWTAEHFLLIDHDFN